MEIPQLPFLPRVTAWLRSAAADTNYEFQPLHMFALIGILAVLYLAERAVDFLFFHLATPGKPLQGYRRRGPKPTYALVAGGSRGIGLGIAKALARHGFGVIILARDDDRLAAAAAQLRDALGAPPPPEDAAEYVRTIAMDAAAATPEDMEAALRAAVVDPGARVSILVNAVPGFAAPPGGGLAACAPEDVDGAVAAGARFPARLTALMLPVLAHRGAGVDGHGMSFGTHRRSLILNVGSGEMVGAPYRVVRGAAAAFSSSFSKGLARELEADPRTSHIDVLSVIPGGLRSRTSTGFPLFRTVPDWEQYGRCVVGKAEGAIGRGWREMWPHWSDHLHHMMTGLVSEKTVTKRLLNNMKVREDAMQAPLETKDQ